MAQKFSTGLMITTGLIAHEMEVSVSFTTFVQSSIQRHIQCDWGDLEPEDIESNEEALEIGARLLSSYNLPTNIEKLSATNQKKIWIITEWNREATTVLFPNEY